MYGAPKLITILQLGLRYNVILIRYNAILSVMSILKTVVNIFFSLLLVIYSWCYMGRPSIYMYVYRLSAMRILRDLPCPFPTASVNSSYLLCDTIACTISDICYWDIFSLPCRSLVTILLKIDCQPCRFSVNKWNAKIDMHGACFAAWWTRSFLRLEADDGIGGAVTRDRVEVQDDYDI
jgi:hypothetical protein